MCPSPLINEEQAAKQKKALQEYNEKRRAEGTIGKRKSLAARIKELLDPSLENIEHVVRGTGDIDKNRYDVSKWIVSQALATEKHNFEIKKLRLSAKKAEAEANAGGYGDNSSAALKAKANEDGTPKLSLAYNPEWDKQRKITDDIPEDEDEYEYDEEDIDE